MARYIDADELYKATQKRIAEANEARMAVVDDEFLDLINDAFTEDVAPRAEWISAEERLPESNTRCVVWSFDYIWRNRFAFYNICTKRWYVVCDDKIKDTKRDGVKVTHWMPLPEPPKGD